MSNDSDNTPEEEVKTDGSGPRCGERLAEARREQQISVLEVAKELHLDEPKVRALERNEFEVLGAPVFAKGHLRKYSQLVGVDEADVFADYYAMTRADGMPPIVSRRKNIRREMSPGPWIAVLAVLIVAAAAYWWFAFRTVPAPLPVESQQPEVAEPEAMQPQPLQREELQPEEQETVTEVEDDTDDMLPATAEPTPATDQVRLTLNFSGECWTEIKDAEGRQLFFSMGSNGQTVELSGKAPISALFGNANNVNVLVNDSAFALPAANSANQTVRVAILNQ